MVSQLWRRLVGFGFRLLYNEMAWTYDAVSWIVSLGEWRAWQREALTYLPAGPTLELAHGPGHMLLALAGAGNRPVGCDLSPAMGRQARRRLHRARLPARLTRCRVQALPFASASFDGILSTFPTDYIVDPATLREAARVLRPGGRLVIVPEGHLTGDTILTRFITWLFVLTGQRPPDRDLPWPEIFRTSRFGRTLLQGLEEAGFTVAIHFVDRRRSSCTVVVATR